VTLGWRSALIVAMVLPVVSLASVATLNALAVPIHQMSVTGLIVALGLLVDAAIVMTDEVGKRLRAGLTRLEAVAGSVRRLTMPLAASTVTTILSFLPLLLLPGPAGISWAPSRFP
jgi:multidrug efflux pump subunit AcrB